MRAVRGIAWLAVVLGSWACASMSTHDRAANEAMDEVYRRLGAAYVLLEADSVGQLYTEDALYLGPDGDIIRGSAAITDMFAGFFESVREQGRSVRISFTSVDRKFAHDLATGVGYYDLVTDSAGRRVGTERRKFATVWRRDLNGVWRIHVDSYSGVEEPEAQGDTAVGR